MTPSFCPNPKCPHHFDDAQPGSYTGTFTSAGFYATRVSGLVARFRCSSCGRYFSERTFSLDYYTKKTLDYAEVFRAVTASESVSAIARHLKCSSASVQNRLERLGRNALATHAHLIHGLGLAEDIVVDGFESFDRSQYFPNNFNLLLGKDSQFLYSYTRATLRRKGRMTRTQHKRRADLDRICPLPRNALRRSCDRLFAAIPQLWRPVLRSPITLWTDEHRTYQQSLSANGSIATATSQGSFIHATLPSKAPRTLANPLFAANYYDRELRKDLAAFRRESTCFTRNVAAGYLRFAVYVAWHNYRKPHRVRFPVDAPSPLHAESVGISHNRIEEEMRRMICDRAFLSKQTLSLEETDIWLKRHRTPLKRQPEYVPQFVSAGHLQGSEN
jgi:transposase-like protein